ncbi:hypothetical protein [Celeribacter sp.]|uniref:hypothetical protein n=1 Tax=Celeribacter sp. TaxID=1890673 RepID=UPI003A9580A4
MKIRHNQTDRLVLTGSTMIIAAAVSALLLGILVIGMIVAIKGYIALGGFALSGVLVGTGILWLVYHKTEVQFDRDNNTLTIRKSMLHGTREETIPLETVRQADVDLKRNQRNNNRLHASYTYRLCIVTEDAHNRKRVPLSHGYTTSKRHLFSARKINNWLGVPEAPIAEGPSMADVAEVIKSLGFGKAA